MQPIKIFEIVVVKNYHSKEPLTFVALKLYQQCE